LLAVSRTVAPIGEWIQADLSDLAGVEGNVDTSEVLADLETNHLSGGKAILLIDLLSIIDCILSLLRATCLKEINVFAMIGEGA
jgi:hypothetical protein